MAFLSPPNTDRFDESVWDVVARVTYGKVTTYGLIAKLMEMPAEIDIKQMRAFGARWVGGSMSRCPTGLPWHRVVNSKGEISLRGGADRQRELLEAEGVSFQDSGKIDLKKFLWEEN